MVKLTDTVAEELTPARRADLDSVLSDLVVKTQEALAGNFLGAYLVGSFALGAGDQHSDVDFLVITREGISALQLDGLREFHRAEPGNIREGALRPDLRLGWAELLEGSYVPDDDVRRPATTDVDRDRWWYLDNGSRELVLSDHDNTAVTRWVLRERAITLAGPRPWTLLDPVPPDALRQEAAGRLAHWQAELRADPDSLANAWLQQHVVLAFCRARYTMETGRVASKSAAGAWGTEHLDARWRELISRAIADRPDPWERLHRTADATLVGVTVEFVEDGCRAAEPRR